MMEKYATSMRKVMFTGLGTLVLAIGFVCISWSAEDPPPWSELGRAASEEEIQIWNIDVASTGEGLPEGRGTVRQGGSIFGAKCAMCHGATGQEGPKDRLVGGQGTLTTAKPIRTVGSYWPYATTLYDYINRAMPFNAPGSLSPDEVYSVVAWLLFQNGIVREDAVIDARTLPQIQMPNRNGFIEDPRPDVHGR